MGATIIDGAFYAYGDMGNLQNPLGTVVLSDPNSDRGPSVFFQGTGLRDLRIFFPKDKVAGYRGVVPSIYSSPELISIDQIPAAVGTANIAAAANVTNGTAMTLASATTTTATGAVVTSIPII